MNHFCLHNLWYLWCMWRPTVVRAMPCKQQICKRCLIMFKHVVSSLNWEAFLQRFSLTGGRLWSRPNPIRKSVDKKTNELCHLLQFVLLADTKKIEVVLIAYMSCVCALARCWMGSFIMPLSRCGRGAGDTILILGPAAKLHSALVKLSWDGWWCGAPD